MIKTVSELIKKLQEFPPDAEIGIEDADTGDPMRISDVIEKAGRILIRGAGYDDDGMFS